MCKYTSRECRVQRWDDERNDYVVFHRIRGPLTDPIPELIHIDGVDYFPGQVSGPSMLVVWYEPRS